MKKVQEPVSDSVETDDKEDIDPEVAKMVAE